MRLTDGPMTRAEFVDALALASVGVIRSDLGANDEIDAALYAVAIDAPHPRPDVIGAAELAFSAAQTS